MDENKLHNVRHSLAHVLAWALREFDPGIKIAIGPVIGNGFYYDVLPTKPIKKDDLPKIEGLVREFAAKALPVTGKEVTPEEARNIFSGEKFKLEMIEDLALKGEKITCYSVGDFTDLCRGGHVENTKEIPLDGFKLSSVAGAYWRGDEKNEMLTRIYGLSFENKAALEEYEKLVAEAEKRDHRKIGKEMQLFSFDDDVGPGLPLFLPNGTIIADEIENLAKEMEFKGGYQRVTTPHLAKESMYLTSGHLPYYKDSMYPPMEYDGAKYYLKAMNCPHHHKVFSAFPKSYRDLPLRIAEYGTVYRHEQSGELFGLMRARSLHMNDAHIYCTEDQFADEFRRVNDLYLHYFKLFGIEKYVMRLSLHDPKELGKKYVNEPELWIKTEEMVRKVMKEANVPFVEVANEAAFYGPKIDIQIWSAIGREFTIATNQVDFAVPKRFGLVYNDKDGTQKTPLCIHRAPLSTHERLLGFLIEHYAGNFPLWLSPVQVAILPIADRHIEHAKKIEEELFAKGFRNKLYAESDTLGKKIRAAKELRVPYLLVIGDAEVKDGTATLENRDKGKIGALTIADIISRLTLERSSRGQE